MFCKLASFHLCFLVLLVDFNFSFIIRLEVIGYFFLGFSSSFFILGSQEQEEGDYMALPFRSKWIWDSLIIFLLSFSWFSPFFFLYRFSFFISFFLPVPASFPLPSKQLFNILSSSQLSLSLSLSLSLIEASAAG